MPAICQHVIATAKRSPFTVLKGRYRKPWDLDKKMISARILDGRAFCFSERLDPCSRFARIFARCFPSQRFSAAKTLAKTSQSGRWACPRLLELMTPLPPSS